MWSKHSVCNFFEITFCFFQAIRKPMQSNCEMCTLLTEYIEALMAKNVTKVIRVCVCVCVCLCGMCLRAFNIKYFRTSMHAGVVC